MTRAISNLPAEGLRFGDYVAVEHIANGGMAEIYLARDGRLPTSSAQRHFVVKRLLPRFAGNKSFLNMFVDEARIARRLEHPNIVRVFDTGNVEDGFFYSMEFLHGHALSAVRKQLWLNKRRMRLEHAIAITLQLCAALEYAHNRCDEHGQPLEIVHRDISHSNVHITFDGRVKLLDFGIARARNRIEETRAGVLKGKLRWMSPEQAFSNHVDHRSDLFSLAVVLWEMTTSRQLFNQKAEFDVLRAIGSGQIRRPSEVARHYPAALEAIVMRGLAKDPADRFQSASELGAALASFARAARLDTSAMELRRLMVELYASEIEDACRAESEYARCLNQLELEAEAETIEDLSIDDLEVELEIDLEEPDTQPVLAPTPLAVTLYQPPSTPAVSSWTRAASLLAFAVSILVVLILVRGTL